MTRHPAVQRKLSSLSEAAAPRLAADRLTSASQAAANDVVCFGPFRLTGAERLLLRDGEPIAIGGRALDLLVALTEQAGEVVSSQNLVDRVWRDVVVEEANLRVNIAALRRALGDGREGNRYIVNVPGRGYSFVAPVHRSFADRAGRAAYHQPAPLCVLRTPSAQPLFGRNDTISDLSSLLLSRRFVSIVGPGGIGKTALALAIEQVLRRQFADRVYFVDLGSLSDTCDVAGAVASALGCFGDCRDAESCIRSCVTDKPILVVLDNCEHVIEAAASFAERLFAVLPTAYVLTTSRERLRVEGETVHLLAPLDTPLDEVPSAREALTSPAVQLFMDRAASGGHLAPLSNADAPVVSRACRRLDGIPLAIELVASRVGSFGIQGTADLIVNGAELLLKGRRGGLARHQTLQAMLDWSFRLLSVDEGRILCRLSTFPGPFTLKDALSAAADLQAAQQSLGRVIASLVDKSLLHASAEEGGARYRLLATTRAYAMAKLTENRNPAS